MRVTMLRRISGTRNGEDWPNVGGSIDLPEDEAKSLVDMGMAEFAKVAAKPEAASVDSSDAETAAAPKPVRRKAVQE